MLPWTRIFSSVRMYTHKTKLMKNRRVESITDFPGSGRRTASLRPASKGRWDKCTIWMARVGCVDNASIYGHPLAPLRASEIIVSEDENAPCPILADICPSLLHLCIFAAGLRVRASPCRRRREPACFKLCPGSLPRAGWTVGGLTRNYFKTDGIVKKILVPHRRHIALFSYYKDLRRIIGAPSFLPELATSLLDKGTFRCLQPSNRDRVRVFARSGRQKPNVRKKETLWFYVRPRRVLAAPRFTGTRGMRGMPSVCPNKAAEVETNGLVYLCQT
ncbi:hypothetical protein C8R44DRAFT_931361 [Mycena epipterygia]|nr:hypothetical protein C8R44DRAFT_931361 [Mycena epipterygia]